MVDHISAASSSDLQGVGLVYPYNGAVVYCGRDGANPHFAWEATSIPSALLMLPDLIIEISMV